MQKNIKATNIELTAAISDYIEKRFSAFDKFVGKNQAAASYAAEVGKTTKHHRSGHVFRAEVSLRLPGESFYAFAERDDLYAAIDEVRDEILRQLKSHKDKSATLMKRGALQFKNFIRGIGDIRRRFKWPRKKFK
ncbi:ribosome-associated translation inhibitor RaiA [Patescibacteria group bacterium]|nr:MAG: ribosome-associated translation inhibitor RaiA [Patescibacteria group bacterium]